MHDQELIGRRSGFAEFPPRRRPRLPWLSEHGRAALLQAGALALRAAAVAGVMAMILGLAVTVAAITHAASHPKRDHAQTATLAP